MTFDEAYRILRAASRYSFASVPIIRITEAIRLIKRIEETYAKPVEMTVIQRDVLLENKEQDTFWVFANLVDDPETFEYHVFRDGLAMSFDDLMHAWLHPELIVVVE